MHNSSIVFCLGVWFCLLFLARGMHIVLLWPACLSQAGAADVRQPGRAVCQTHEHHLHLGPQRGHRLLHHREQRRKHALIWCCTVCVNKMPFPPPPPPEPGGFLWLRQLH